MTSKLPDAAAGSAPQASAAHGLPERPSLENLKKQAKALLKRHRAGDAAALERVAKVTPHAVPPIALHDAQLVLAREHGFASWPRLVAALAPSERIRRDQGRVWIADVPRLRWGSSPEPTYIGALEAAFRHAERPLDVTTLLGDSGLAFRLRWATRDGGDAWCGSGPCGEWPEEVAALNRATGYVYEWDPPEAGAAGSPEHRALIVESIERGWPILGFARHMDMAVFYGYEDEGRRLLVSDYWATEEPSLVALAEAKSVAFFLRRVDASASRVDAVRAGLTLALSRFRAGVVERDPITGATYHYGEAGYRRWRHDLGRAASLGDAQRAGLFFLNGWTFSALHSGRSKHAARYLRSAVEQLPAAREALEEAAACYDAMRERLGAWDPADPTFGFVKQLKVESWTPEVRAREIALLEALEELDARAMSAIERALAAAAPPSA